MTGEVRPIFELYVDDDRYEVPTLRFCVANDETEARELAMQMLEESPHHRGVEVRLGDRRISAVGSFATTSSSPGRVRQDLIRAPRLACGGAG